MSEPLPAAPNLEHDDGNKGPAGVRLYSEPKLPEGVVWDDYEPDAPSPDWFFALAMLGCAAGIWATAKGYLPMNAGSSSNMFILALAFTLLLVVLGAMRAIGIVWRVADESGRDLPLKWCLLALPSSFWCTLGLYAAGLAIAFVQPDAPDLLRQATYDYLATLIGAEP